MEGKAPKMTTSLPPHPNNVGVSRKIIGIDGTVHRFTITDEIILPQTGLPSKLIYLQYLQFDDGRNEVRLAYYMIGFKPGRKGRWVWGQYCTILPHGDLKTIYEEAQKRGWL